VIHGADDTISPPDDGRAFARAGGGSVALVPGAGHADLFVPGEPTRPEIADALASFFSASA
jgi:pimeloyl-ACP methyl ester carboxylesterase